MNDIPKETNALPGTMLKIAKATWDGYFYLQNKWLDLFGLQGKPAEALKIDLSQDLFKSWIDRYEQGFGKLMTLPQLGLTRYHQERTTEVFDKFNLFQAKMAEFVCFLTLPLERSFKVMQERLGELSKDGKISQDPRDYYQMWVKTLEEYYISFFKSSEYNETMRSTLDSMEEYLMARQKFLQGVMQLLSIPTCQDFDDLSKDFYELKKRVKELAKKVNQE